MEPIVTDWFIDSVDNISIVNFDVPSLSPPDLQPPTDDVPSSVIPSMDGDLLSSLGYPTSQPSHYVTTNGHHHHQHHHHNHHHPRAGRRSLSVLLSARSLDDCDDQPMPSICSAKSNGFVKFDDVERPEENDDYRSHGPRRTISSIERVRTWKKYQKKKHLTQAELDRKRDLANKQERKRMHKLNNALDTLRKKIQTSPYLQQPQPLRRLSKIKTLRLAIHYIQCLQETLTQY